MVLSILTGVSDRKACDEAPGTLRPLGSQQNENDCEKLQLVYLDLRALDSKIRGKSIL